jgi:predicted TIM-barrel fold metal-dependent hydrolase
VGDFAHPTDDQSRFIWENVMELHSDRGRRVAVDELNTTRLLAHARQQAHRRKFDDMLIVDVDAHHYENEHIKDILPFMENDVLRQLAYATGMKGGRGTLMPQQVGYQDIGGRVTRYPLRASEKTDPDRPRDVQLGERWMDAMGVDYSCMFPTGMLNIGLHPQKEMEVDLCWAYNRWVTEKVLPESGGRLFSMLCLPFSDPDACLRQVETFGHRDGVGGFMVTTVRTLPVHDNAYMKVYRAIEERGLVLSFHSAFNWSENVFRGCNRFIAVHALGFSFYNILHCTNWVVNGLGERFPKLPVIWIESGLAWVPFLMQRLDHEYMMRPSECPTPGDGADIPHDGRRKPPALRLGLSALGLRPAVDDLGPAVPLREGKAQHPWRQRGAPVQAEAAE